MPDDDEYMHVGSVDKHVLETVWREFTDGIKADGIWKRCLGCEGFT